MAQDYPRSGKQNSSRTPAARRNGPPPKRSGSGRMLPFVAGLSAGVLLCVLTWLAGWVPPAGGTGSSGDAPTAGTVPPPGIRFEFPDMLRDAEVLVPYVEEYLQPEAAREQNVDYMLQAGAFRNAEDADRRRAAILLLDLNARTLRVTRQGESWNRVLVGPFSNRNRVRDAQLRLLEEDIDSIVLKTAHEAGG